MTPEKPNNLSPPPFPLMGGNLLILADMLKAEISLFVINNGTRYPLCLSELSPYVCYEDEGHRRSLLTSTLTLTDDSLFEIDRFLVDRKMTRVVQPHPKGFSAETVHGLSAMLEARPKEDPSDFSEKMNEALRQQWLFQRAIWVAMGMSGVPNWQEIDERLKKPDFIKKYRQGFKDLLMVPFGESLTKLNKLSAKYVFGGPIVVRGCDINTDPNKVVYAPQSFDPANHGGFSKRVALEGKFKRHWEVFLVEPDHTIPRLGKGKTIAGRKQVEANISPSVGLGFLYPYCDEYPYEEGFTPEMTIAQHIIGKKSGIYYDANGYSNSVCNLNLGAYLPKKHAVLLSFWDKPSNRLHFDTVPADQKRTLHMGMRTAIRVI